MLLWMKLSVYNGRREGGGGGGGGREVVVPLFSTVLSKTIRINKGNKIKIK